jgi:hypothetical protein
LIHLWVKAPVAHKIDISTENCAEGLFEVHEVGQVCAFGGFDEKIEIRTESIFPARDRAKYPKAPKSAVFCHLSQDRPARFK